MTKLKQRHWKAWAVVWGIAFVIEEILLTLIPGITRTVLGWAWFVLGQLMALPLGYGGLALVIFLALLFGLSFWERRPVKATVKQPLSPEEKELVQHHRTLWELQGRAAAEHLERLFELTRRHFEDQHYLFPLLLPVEEKLRETRAEWARSVADDGLYTIDEVRERFNTMYSAYLACCRWLGTIDSEQGKLESCPHHKQLFLWRKLHQVFWDAIEIMLTDPRHKKTLDVYVQWIAQESNRLQRFLAATGQDTSMFRP